jgi:hypothetical protein
VKAPDDSIAISEIGEVGICERRVYLRKKYGLRTNRAREERLNRGTKVHQAAYEQSRPDEKRVDKRCFIATSVYGVDAIETEHLRCIRDRYLMPNSVGMFLVRMYYGASPRIAQACEESERLRRAVRVVLDLVVKATRGMR